MQITWITYAVVCPMVFLAGLVDAIGGGGGLISLPAYLISGLPPHVAIATNKLSSATGTAVSTGRYCVNGCVDWKSAVPGTLAAVLGAQIGARFSLATAEEILRILLLILLPLIAVYMIFRKDPVPEDGKPVPRKKQLCLITFVSLILGLYDGFYGPGTGTFLLLLYTGLCGLSAKQASGNVKLANLASNVSSLAVFLQSGNVLIGLGLAAAAFSIAGHWVGSGLAIRKGTRLIRFVILGVILLFLVRTVTDLFL